MVSLQRPHCGHAAIPTSWTGCGDQCVILGIANEYSHFSHVLLLHLGFVCQRVEFKGWILDTPGEVGQKTQHFGVGRCGWKWPKKRCVLSMCVAVKDCHIYIYVMLFKGINKWWMWNDYVRSGFPSFLPLFSGTTDTGGLSFTQMAWVETLTVVR